MSIIFPSKIKMLIANFLVLNLLCMSNLFAEEPKQEAPPVKDETQFFATVNETGGYINQQLHHEFWELMKQKYDEEQRSKIVNDIQNTLDVLKEFQAQTWK